MATPADIPLVQIRDLVLHTGSPDSNTTLIASLGNDATVRYKWDALTAALPRSTTAPGTPTTAGTTNNIAADATGFYSYSDGAWGKSPRYTRNWDDLTEATRFLRTDAAMTLSQAEKDNVLTSVGLQEATGDTLGLVKGSESVVIDAEGTMTVPQATTSSYGLVKPNAAGDVAAVTYVNAQIGQVNAAIEELSTNLPIATSSAVGGIKSSASVSVHAATGIATVPTAIPDTEQAAPNLGLVQLAATTPTTLATYIEDVSKFGYATSVKLVSDMIDLKLETSRVVATTQQAGVVQPTGSIVITNTTAGAIDVQKADETHYGTVKAASEIPAVIPPGSEAVVPNMAAVTAYVEAGATGMIAGERLPFANNTTQGSIKSSASVRVNQVTGQATVPNATVNTTGIVRVQAATNDTAPYTVTSVAYVTAAITAAVANVQWNGGVVANLVTCNGGIRTVSVTNPPDDAVLNYGQLKQLFTQLP